MLVLLSFALVLVATVLLVLGLLNDDGINLIYLSIASSVAAAVVLVVALRMARPRAERDASGPAPLPEPEREPALAAVAPATAPAVAASEARAGGDDWSASDSWDEPAAEADEVDFPIADYETLSVAQILPLLPQLYADEIDVVEQREREGKSRPQILAKLDELRSSPAGADDSLASYTESAASSYAAAGDDWFPIEDYESLSAAQIRPLLPELDDEELAMVRAKEESLGGRQSLLDDIDRRLGVTTRAAARPTPAKRATPAKKAAVKRTAKKTTAKKAAAPARKTTAKKATTARKTTAKKTTAAKKAAPAKKATAAKKTTAKKATTARKTTAKKAAPAKKATKATKKR